MKIVVLLRNPIERAYSHWNMERERGNDKLNFLEALEREAERVKEALPLQHRIYSYVDRGFYTEQLRRLWHFFSKDQVLVLKSEWLRNKPLETLNRIFRFIGVSEMQRVDVRQEHVRNYCAPMGQQEREYLRTKYEYEVRGLERLLVWDCRDWID